MYNTSEAVRSADKEYTTPVKGVVQGEIPSWIRGSLYRNGPGLFEVGPDEYNHWFDGLAIVHKFEIQNGEASYRSQFLRSETYTKNETAQRIVVSEFGTVAFPDPCKNIFWRYFSLFFPEPTDNTSVNVVPLGDEIYCTTDGQFMNRIDPETLDCLGQQNLTNVLSVNFATAHPHVDENGTLHNMGMIFRDKETGGPAYCIINIDRERKSNGELNGRVVAKIPARWKFTPSYYHSFGITENFYVFVEAPLCINVLEALKNKMLLRPGGDVIQWQEDQPALIHLVARPKQDETVGQLVATYTCDPFFTFHHMNAFEDAALDAVVVDMSCYDDGRLFEKVTLKEMKNAPKSDGAKSVGGCPRRFVLPLAATKFQPGTAHMKLVPEYLIPRDSKIFFEFPAVNYARCNGRPYRFVYGTSFSSGPGSENKITKLEPSTKKTAFWCPPADEGWLPSEPVFVAQPEALQEDDGVLLVSLLRLPVDQPTRELHLVIIDAKSMTEIARVHFPDVSVPRDLHGAFLHNTGL